MAGFASRLSLEADHLKKLARDDARLARDPTDSDGASAGVELRLVAWREYGGLDYAREVERVRRTLTSR